MTRLPRKPQTTPLLRDDAPLQSRPIRKRNPAQPRLPFDAMPERIEPCLALLKRRPPQGDEWSYEIKWDGYRLAVHVEPDGVRIITRGGLDWTHRFPGIADAAKALGPATMILDGEAVVLDEQGRSDFGLLQRSLGATGKQGGKLASDNAVLFAFDLLYFDGHDLTGTEQRVRRHLLQDALVGAPDAIRISEEFDADPDELLAHACRLGLEGIIAKHRDRPYRSGWQGDWLKIKCVQSDSFAIIGYEPSTKVPGAIASLLLAARYRDGWEYVGSVGTGFKHDEARALKKQLDKLKTKLPPVKVPGKNLVLTSANLVAEIEYRAWTNDRKLRHASFKGLREAEDAADVYRLADWATTTDVSAQTRGKCILQRVSHRRLRSTATNLKLRGKRFHARSDGREGASSRGGTLAGDGGLPSRQLFNVADSDWFRTALHGLRLRSPRSRARRLNQLSSSS